MSRGVARGVFYGIGLTAIVQGALVGIGFAIAGLPSPVVFGVLAAILALLPAGGAAIVCVSMVLYVTATSLSLLIGFRFLGGIGEAAFLSTDAPVRAANARVSEFGLMFQAQN